MGGLLMAEPSAPQALKFPAGLDNRARESALPGGSLRVCQNLDVTKEGNLLTRQGLRRVAAGGCHSFYGVPYGDFALCVQSGALMRFDGTTLTALRSVHPNAAMSYAALNSDVFFTNGYEQGRVTASGDLALWGLPTPPSPACQATDSGGMRAGTVRVTQTAVVGGMESGAPEPVSVTVPDGGGVRVTVPTGASFAVYATEVDGDLFRRAAIVASGESVIIGAGFSGKPLDSLFAVKPLPGQFITAHRGRLWVASGSVVWFTDTLSPHWLFPHEGYYAFEASITLLAAAEDGLYVGTAERVFYLQGSKPSEMTLRPVLQRGAIFGSGTNDIPTDVLLGQGSFPSRCCAFLDTEGVFCIGRPGGIVQRITDDHYVAGNAGQAPLAYWQHDGLRQFAVAMIDTVHDANAALDRQVQATFANGVSLV